MLRTPKKGLGQAYLDVIPYIRGDFIIMGDCDLTYDFRNIKPFVQCLREGSDFVMGSRFKGSIEKGAMPALHRYFGTPLTTWLLNKIYKSTYTDIHCGMRGLTKSALIKMNLTSKGWEYASEMVLKASRMDFNISEVPVNFYKDRDGRESHHRRIGFLSPWIAGWVNLRVMLVYSPDSFLIKPGAFCFIFGLLFSALSSFGSLSIGKIGFNLYSHLLGLTAMTLGYSLFQVGIFARNDHGLRHGIERWILCNLRYNRGIFIAGIFILAGIFLCMKVVGHYINNDFLIQTNSHTAINGLLMLIFGVQTFSFTLLLDLRHRISGDAL